MSKLRCKSRSLTLSQLILLHMQISSNRQKMQIKWQLKSSSEIICIIGAIGFSQAAAVVHCTQSRIFTCFSGNELRTFPSTLKWCYDFWEKKTERDNGNEMVNRRKCWYCFWHLVIDTAAAAAAKRCRQKDDKLYKSALKRTMTLRAWQKKRERCWSSNSRHNSIQFTTWESYIS